MNRVEKTTKMRENGESFRTNSLRVQKSDKINPESKMESSSPDEKFTLPSIHPTVIQALPSDRQALPSLQPTDQLSLPKIQSKDRKAPRRPKSGVRRILPSIPTVGELNLPSIQANAATPVKLPILSTIEEQAKPSAPSSETKVRPTVKSVRRILPSIPPTEELTLPSIEPTAVKAQPKIIIMRRRRRMLPILPTIIENTSPKPTEVDATEESVDNAENGASKNPEAKENDGLSTPQSVVEETQKILQPVEKEARPSQTEELGNVKPKQKAAAQRPQKISKGTQTILKSAEEEVMPSLKPIKKKLPENSGTEEEPLPRAPTTKKTNENQPRDKDTQSSVQVKEKRVPKPPVKADAVKPQAWKAPQSPQPSLEKALPKRAMTRSARAIRQMAKAKALSVPPLKLEHERGARRIKSSPQSTKVKPLSSIQGKVRQTQTLGEAFSPQHTVEHKIPRPPAARRMKLSPQATEVPPASVQGKMKQTQRKAEAQLSPQHTVEHKNPRPPAARRMKLSPQATDVEPLKSVQGTVRQTQKKGKALLYPMPPPARRTKVSPQTTQGKSLESVEETSGQAQTKVEAVLHPRPPPLRRTKVSPQTTARETLEGVQGTLGQTQANSEAPLSPQLTLEHNFPMPPAPAQFSNASQTKVSPAVTETEAAPSLPPSKKETPPNFQPKPGSYAFLNLKRREFEALQRLQLMAKQYRANGESVGKGRHSRDLLTVKPALPPIQSTQETAVMLKPHPPEPTTKKGLPSARPAGKRPHPKLRATLDRELPGLQPTVKQVLPSISSSNLHTLVKKPLPSVQPEQRFTEESDGHLPRGERQ